jgi:hypothetical protein
MAADKYTAAQMIEALTKGRGLVSVAARALGCSQTTVQRYIREYPTVAQVVQDQRARLVDSAELRLVEAIETKAEPWAIAMVLKTLGKDRGYVERVEQEHSGSVALTWAQIVAEHGGADGGS